MRTSLISFLLLMTTCYCYAVDLDNQPGLDNGSGSVPDYVPDYVIDELMELSGINALIEQIPGHMQSGLNSEDLLSSQGVDRKDIQALMVIFSGSFSETAIRADVISHFEKYYDKALFSKMSQTLQAPLVKRMTALEIRASDDGTYQALLAYAETLIENPPTKDRVALMMEFDQVMHATEVTALLQIEVTSHILQALYEYGVEQDSIPPGKISDLFDFNHQAIFDEAEQLVLISNLFTYREVSDADVRTYIDLYQQQHAQWFLGLASTAIMKAMSQAGARSGRRIAEYGAGIVERAL